MSLIGVVASLEKTVPMGQVPSMSHSVVSKNKLAISPVTRAEDPCFKPDEKASSVVEILKKWEISCPFHTEEHNALIFTHALNQGW